MIQRDKYSDRRYDGMCSYCGGNGNTKDHVPSKVLLDEEYPTNMHKVDCCFECNQSFSSDEVYFACLIECIIHGSTNPEEISRPKIKRILTKKEHLRRKISESMSVHGDTHVFQIDEKAVENVLMKLARGHAAFEASQPRLNPPSFFGYKPLHLMTEQERECFISAQETEIFPEVGSRLFNQLVLDNSNTPFSSWITVQENAYLYMVTSQISRFSVKLIIWDYLAAEAIWED